MRSIVRPIVAATVIAATFGLTACTNDTDTTVTRPEPKVAVALSTDDAGQKCTEAGLKCYVSDDETLLRDDDVDPNEAFHQRIEFTNTTSEALQLKILLVPTIIGEDGSVNEDRVAIPFGDVAPGAAMVFDAEGVYPTDNWDGKKLDPNGNYSGEVLFYIYEAGMDEKFAPLLNLPYKGSDFSAAPGYYTLTSNNGLVAPCWDNYDCVASTDEPQPITPGGAVTVTATVTNESAKVLDFTAEGTLDVNYDSGRHRSEKDVRLGAVRPGETRTLKAVLHASKFDVEPGKTYKALAKIKLNGTTR